MRVAHIMKVNNIAGAERHLLTLIAAQVERGLDVCLLMLVDPNKPMNDMRSQVEAHGARVHRLVIQHDLDLTIIWRLRTVLRKIDADIVHTHLIHADTYGIPAARLAVKPAISSRHDDSGFRRNLPVRLINNLTWRGVARGIAISEALAQFSIGVEGAPMDRMRVVHYGIPHSESTPDAIQTARSALRRELGLHPGATLIGTVSRLIPLKGIHYALDAFAKIVVTSQDLHLIIVGDGPERGKLEQQTRSNNLTARVHFLGWQSDVERIFAALDVLLVPSTREGFGLVMLEAMSKRVPIIASDVSAIPEVIDHGVTGLLVPPMNPTALADAMLQLIEDEALRKRMGERAEERLKKHFTVEKMVDGIIAVYEEVLQSTVAP